MLLYTIVNRDCWFILLLTWCFYFKTHLNTKIIDDRQSCLKKLWWVVLFKINICIWICGMSWGRELCANIVIHNFINLNFVLFSIVYRKMQPFKIYYQDFNYFLNLSICFHFRFGLDDASVISLILFWHCWAIIALE